MRLKSEYGAGQSLFAGSLADGAQKLLVAEMHTVEVADGKCAVNFLRTCGKAAKNMPHAGV